MHICTLFKRQFNYRQPLLPLLVPSKYIYSVEITNLCMTSVWFEWWSSVVPFVRPSFVVFLPRTASYLSCWELSILEVLCCREVSWFFTNSFWQPGGPFHQKLSERVFACKIWWHLAASQLPHVWLDHEANIGRPSELPGCQHLSALIIERYLSDIWKISESLKDAKKKQKIKRIGIELILIVVTKSDCSMLHGALRKCPLHPFAPLRCCSLLAGGVRDATSNTTTEGGKTCHFHQYFWILLGVFSQFRKLVLSHLESLRLERVERVFCGE